MILNMRNSPSGGAPLPEANCEVTGHTESLKIREDSAILSIKL